MGKIICIVKNDSDSNDTGLIQAFNRNQNAFIKKYLYQYNGLTDFSDMFGNNTDYKYLNINQNLVTPKKTPPSNEEAWDILLVCDNVDIDEIKKIPFTPETLVMYHQEPIIVNQFFIQLQTEKKIRKCKEGHHEPDEKDGYYHLLDLTNAWNGYNFDSQKYTLAKEKLIHWFDLNEKLNKALEFLHKSFRIRPAMSDILTEGQEIYNLQKEFKKGNEEKKLSKWIEELDKKEGVNYINALAIVRDALLEQLGETGDN